MTPEEVYEIRVRPVKELSLQARQEVEGKLATKDAKFLSNYKGFASITLVSASPLTVKSVDPIEGDFASLFAQIVSQSTHRASAPPS